MAESRMKNSIKNFRYGAFTQILSTVFSFISRTVFIKILGEQYLGINGLFTNILTVLSFAELGIGNAIIFSMYKPIAIDDTEKVNALMNLYKKCYRIIGVVVLLVGVAITPFINLFIKDPPNIPESLYFIYLLYVINTALSYFFTYKKSIISAHQKEYIINGYRMFFIVFKNIVQIAFLVVTHNFIVYLILQIICTFLENLSLSIKANKMYPYIETNNYQEISKEEKGTIFKNVKSLIMYKFGSVILNGTSNIVISKMIGVVIVGFYSNYLMIVQAVSNVVGNALNGITANIGNLNATANEKVKEKTFYELFFISVWIFGFCSIALLTLLNPFIELWIGNNYLLEYKLLFESLSEKKKIDVEFKEYKLCELFDFDKGKSKYTKKYGYEHKGEYPVYSASNIAPLTYIDSFDFDGRYLTWATNGFAGYMKVIDGKFSINGDRGIMIPKIANINIDYIRYILQPKLRKLAKGRKGEKGEDEFTKLYISMIDKLSITMPLISDTDIFSLEYQNDFVEKKNKENEFLDDIMQKQNEIKELNIEEIYFENSKKIKIKELFDIKKGKSIYTNKYFHENKGKYPVYSSQTYNNGEIAKINSYDYDEKCLTWTTDGIYAGTIFLRNNKFSMTTHCGALLLKNEYKEDILLEYLYAYLYGRLKKYAKGVQNKRVTVDIIKNIEIEIPIDINGNYDKEQQFYFSQMFEQFQQSKQDIISRLDSIANQNIDWI